jgi:hypothetical protein
MSFPLALKRLVRVVLYAAYSLLAASLLLFVLLEASPSLRRSLGAHRIRYWALQEQFAPNPVLVFVHRQTNYSRTTSGKGDLYNPRYRVEPPTIHYVESYNELGFRSNSSPPPYELLVIGDSYIQIGETDDDTLSERLAQKTGLSTFNLGRGWYGPHQYLELLRRHGPELGARYALFCFFDGNDVENVEESPIRRGASRIGRMEDPAVGVG